MASESRAAQEKLVELEKDSAPFEEQLLEAARFIGVDLEDVAKSFEQIHDLELKSKAATYHGREEWLLRWLLKKLQASKDDVPRRTASSWLLFRCLIEKIPEPNVARMLSERKFMTILRQTLEETLKIDSNSERAKKDTSDSTLINLDKSSKVSKKRKRSGELVTACGSGNHGTQDLLGAVFAAISYMIGSTKVISRISEEERTAAFSTEYMKSVIKTPAEDAAKILGTWLSLSRISLSRYKNASRAMRFWLTPFIEIWDSRTIQNEDLMQFSLYSSQPLLSLLEIMKAKGEVFDWKDELEQLVARNIMVPAKAAKVEKADSDLLTTLTRISVLQDSANAPTLFEVAIRSIQPHGSRRRRPNDDAWLQTVFDTLREAMPSQRAEENGKAVRDMLQGAINYKVDIDLSTLRSITSEYGLPKGNTSWDLLAMITELDTNVFLIPNGEKDLLQEVLNRITTASLEPTWSSLSVQVVGDVVVPLMNGFAKARDLSGFIHHWYDQLVDFERLRRETSQSSITLFSAWEADALQIQLSKIMESSLTVPQIVQLVDWLSSQVTKSPDAVCLILDAIAGSVFQEDVIDAVELRLFHITFDNDISKMLDSRYKWRSWRMLCRTLNWITPSSYEELSLLWEKHAVPFDSLSRKFERGSLLGVVDGNMVELETLETVRFLCAAWNVAKKGTQMETLVRKPVLDILQSLAQDIKLLLRDLRGNQKLGEEKCGSTLNTLYRGSGWMLWSYINCVLVEYPRVLQLGLELKDPVFRDFLQSIFWIASIPNKDNPSDGLNLWLSINHEAFPTTWTSMLNNDDVLSNTALISQIIHIVLSCQNNEENPLVKSPTNNAFAVNCLLRLPLEVFSRKDREHIMKGWLQVPRLAGEDAIEKTSCESTALDPAVLSLKVKIMQRPTVYEGMKYQDLVNLADCLASAEVCGLDTNLGLFKELVRRTMSHITANLDQPRNRDYTLDALKHLQKKSKAKTDSKKGSKLNYALITLFEALLSVLLEKERQLNDLDIIRSDDLSSVTESFKNILLTQRFKKSSNSGKESDKSLTALATINALTTLKIDELELAKFADSVMPFTSSLKESDSNTKKWLETFISTYTRSSDSEALDLELGGDISSVYGRQAIMEKARALTGGKDQHEKLTLLESVLRGSAVDSMPLDKIFALRFIIAACEDARLNLDENDEDDPFDLSTVHSVLCSHLWKRTSTRQFCLISETLVMMLRTKSRAMTQWNIDSTLGSIAITCSRNGPPLRSTRAGTIYMHLCRLTQAILTSHRLKLQGHLHLIVQVMQALLRCLFTPLPHSTAKSTKVFASPPWLSSPKSQLKAAHGAAYTRLITLICDPSVSSVTRSKHNNLTSATDKAKRMAGQHMQFVLLTYIQLQLEMKMLPEIREKMVPGLYAIFDTTTPETRRMIGDSLDSSGRALFGTLFKDYQKFGKWKGL